jgi:hypothetical protein
MLSTQCAPAGHPFDDRDGYRLERLEWAPSGPEWDASGISRNQRLLMRLSVLCTKSSSSSLPPLYTCRCHAEPWTPSIEVVARHILTTHDGGDHPSVKWPLLRALLDQTHTLTLAQVHSPHHTRHDAMETNDAFLRPLPRRTYDDDYPRAEGQPYERKPVRAFVPSSTPFVSTTKKKPPPPVPSSVFFPSGPREYEDRWYHRPATTVPLARGKGVDVTTPHGVRVSNDPVTVRTDVRLRPMTVHKPLGPTAPVFTPSPQSSYYHK